MAQGNKDKGNDLGRCEGIRRLWLLGLPLLAIQCAAHAQTRIVHYYYTDPQGNVLAKADAQGNIVERYDYRPYGGVVQAPGPDGPGFTGHVNDPETGLVYMQARYYQPIGRFLSPDPVAPAAGNIYSFNRYAYANLNPVRYVDPDGRTCTEVNKTYSCQIDKVVTMQSGKPVTRDATAQDHKTYAAVEQSLTKAVNAAASSGKTANISFTSGKTTYSFSVSGTSVANNLAVRIIRVDPFNSGAMDTEGHTTNVDQFGIHPGRTVLGSEERTREIDFLHEGIHRTAEERKALGFFGLLRMANDQDPHQDPYNAAAATLLGPEQ